MTTIRSLLFVAWLYLSMALFAVGLSPALLMPYRQAMWVIRHWSKFTLFGLRWIAGVKVEFRGIPQTLSGSLDWQHTGERYRAHMVILSADRARLHFYLRQWWSQLVHASRQHQLRLSIDVDPQEFN